MGRAAAQPRRCVGALFDRQTTRCARIVGEAAGTNPDPASRPGALTAPPPTTRYIKRTDLFTMSVAASFSPMEATTVKKNAKAVADRGVVEGANSSQATQEQDLALSSGGQVHITARRVRRALKNLKLPRGSEGDRQVRGGRHQ